MVGDICSRYHQVLALNHMDMMYDIIHTYRSTNEDLMSDHYRTRGAALFLAHQHMLSKYKR